MKESHFSFEETMGGLMGRSSKMLGTRLLRRFRKNDLKLTTIEQMVVLIHLWKEDGQTQQALGECSKHHKTLISRAINRLEKLNMVLRVPDQNDGRIRRVYLTTRGKQVRLQIIPHVQLTLAEVLADIDAQELETCKSVLRKILTNLQKLETE